ncbi:MAG: hypothetical protein RL603_2057 [Pseudomonadota bacterium]
MKHCIPVLMIALSGCAARPLHSNDEPAALGTDVVATASHGAIYRDGRDLRLFEHYVARGVGDVLTVRLAETTDASKSASTSTKKSAKADLPGPLIGGRPVTVGGTRILQGGLADESSFAGEGASRQSNRLYGDVTVTVERRLANGDLYVRGEKVIIINQGRESIRVSGVVRPVDIEPDNSVVSTKLGAARISYSGSGALADSNTPSLLSRLFGAPWLPF